MAGILKSKCCKGYIGPFKNIIEMKRYWDLIDPDHSEWGCASVREPDPRILDEVRLKVEKERKTCPVCKEERA